MKIILYAILGVVLSAAGVGILTQPMWFCLIVAIVIGVEISSHSQK